MTAHQKQLCWQQNIYNFHSLLIHKPLRCWVRLQDGFVGKSGFGRVRLLRCRVRVVRVELRQVRGWGWTHDPDRAEWRGQAQGRWRHFASPASLGVTWRHLASFGITGFTRRHLVALGSTWWQHQHQNYFSIVSKIHRANEQNLQNSRRGKNFELAKIRALNLLLRHCVANTLASVIVKFRYNASPSTVKVSNKSNSHQGNVYETQNLRREKSDSARIGTFNLMLRFFSAGQRHSGWSFILYLSDLLVARNWDDGFENK